MLGRATEVVLLKGLGMCDETIQSVLEWLDRIVGVFADSPH